MKALNQEVRSKDNYPGCDLDKEINQCPYFDRERGTCKNQDTSCSMRTLNTGNTEAYQRKERWYEQYYR